jgi:outer membrane protein assembly factor BamE (lipoprotein component of BamABCDE complex)
MKTPNPRRLWNAFLPAIVALFVLACVSGCSTPYTITMNDGSTIETKDEPKLDRRSGFYEYKNTDGKTARVNKDQVRKMQPTR